MKQVLKNTAVFAAIYVPLYFIFRDGGFTAGANCAIVASAVATFVFPLRGE